MELTYPFCFSFSTNFFKRGPCAGTKYTVAILVLLRRLLLGIGPKRLVVGVESLPDLSNTRVLSILHLHININSTSEIGRAHV